MVGSDIFVWDGGRVVCLFWGRTGGEGREEHGGLVGCEGWHINWVAEATTELRDRWLPCCDKSGRRLLVTVLVLVLPLLLQ